VRLLLDTHAFLWWVTESPRLSARARSAIADTEAQVRVSVVTIWEIAIKKRLDRLVYPDDFAAYTRGQFADNDFAVLDVTLDHVFGVYDLAQLADHRDPFDRMLAAQARTEGLALVSADANFDRYGIERVW